MKTERTIRITLELKIPDNDEGDKLDAEFRASINTLDLAFGKRARELREGEFLGSRQQATSSQPPMSSAFPPQSPPPTAGGELPPSIMPFLKKKSETAYDVADESILEPNGKLKLEYYRAVKKCRWAYSPAKKLIWKPK